MKQRAEKRGWKGLPLVAYLACWAGWFIGMMAPIGLIALAQKGDPQELLLVAMEIACVAWVPVVPVALVLILLRRYWNRGLREPEWGRTALLGLLGALALGGCALLARAGLIRGPVGDAVAISTFLIPATVAGMLTRKSAAGDLTCKKCGYDLRAHQAGQRCPECGAEIQGTESDKMPGAKRSNE